jgi:hypothetical protein
MYLKCKEKVTNPLVHLIDDDLELRLSYFCLLTISKKKFVVLYNLFYIYLEDTNV